MRRNARLVLMVLVSFLSSEVGASADVLPSPQATPAVIAPTPAATASSASPRSAPSASIATSAVGTKTKPRLVTVPLGTQIPIFLDRKISSQSDSTGDVFTFTVAADVYADNMLVIAKGAAGEGHIQEVTKASWLGKTGTLVPAFDWVKGVDGNKIRVTGVSRANGDYNYTSDIAAGAATQVAISTAPMVAGAFIPFLPLAGVFNKGKKAEIGTDTGLKLWVESTVHVTSDIAAKADGFAH